MKYRFKHVIEYSLLRGMSGLARLLPYRAALALGWGLAALSFGLSSKLRNRARRRLKQVFGTTCDDKGLRRIAWISWRNLVFNAIEALRIPSLTAGWVRKVVIQNDIPKILDVLKENRGVVLAIPHMGNWELAGVGGQLLGLSITTIARRQKNPLTDAYLNRMRAHTGMVTLLTDSKALTGIIRALREGRVVAILPDLRAKTRSVRVRFLGVETDLPTGMALFAREAGAPIVPSYAMREGWARHRWVVHEPIRPDPSLDRDADIQRMTQAVMDVLDAEIRAHPEQYFWYNKRWVLGEE